MKEKYQVKAEIILTQYTEDIIADSENEAKIKCIQDINRRLSDCGILDKANITYNNFSITKYKFIMQDLNNHNKELVEKINEIYNNDYKLKSFLVILERLIMRDEYEINNIFVDYPIMPFADYTDERMVFDLIHNYLTFIADDNDLDVIIKFCR